MMPPFDSSAMAANIYHTGITFSIDLEVNKDFETIAAGMLKLYQRDLIQNEGLTSTVQVEDRWIAVENVTRLLLAMFGIGMKSWSFS
ncbi:hypothetical protein N7466_004379 [Penicillium verhagenii]|uniref:uncharacterized protein n=1 Tax=Penicillium verhagenii TaxID=1562060 RepID=UPI0025451462|nr:uncharacterized protein N7466_004379 [Penicillium verhagenii]KAJ5934832.1 hypothetical protein N7466_004379 [Penicillium verhagenii]